MENRQGHLYIISAPSGAGKTSLIKALLKSVDNLQVSISHTTRPRRSNEVDGVDYHFISVKEYQQMLFEDDFLEHAEVFGNYYGTSQKAVEKLVNQGTDVILELDWQGAKQIKQKMPKAIKIFVLPPSLEALHQRLCDRAQDDETVIQQRMQEAKQEMSHYNEYQFIIINDEFEVAFNQLESLVTAERLRLERQYFENKDLIQNLIND